MSSSAKKTSSSCVLSISAHSGTSGRRASVSARGALPVSTSMALIPAATPKCPENIYRPSFFTGELRRASSQPHSPMNNSKNTMKLITIPPFMGSQSGDVTAEGIDEDLVHHDDRCEDPAESRLPRETEGHRRRAEHQRLPQWAHPARATHGGSWRDEEPPEHGGEHRHADPEEPLEGSVWPH